MGNVRKVRKKKPGQTTKPKRSGKPKQAAKPRQANKTQRATKQQTETVDIPVWKMDDSQLKLHRIREFFRTDSRNAGRYDSHASYETARQKTVRQETVRQKKVPPRRVKREHKPLSMRAKVLCIVFASLAVLFVSAYAYVVHTYTIRTVYVEGNSHYTDQEIIDRVMTGRWGHNSLYLNFRYRHREIEDIPFVSALEVKIVTPDTVRITVYEKSLAGYVSYLGRYMYFDKDGTVVESSQEQTQGIPLVTGLAFDHVVKYEKLPIKNAKVFAEILDITQALTKYSLKADRIYFDEDSKVTLYFGEVRVKIGDDSNIDEKLSQMQAILPKLEGKRGVLQLEEYTSDTKTVTFQSDDTLTAGSTSGNDVSQNDPAAQQ